MADFDWKAVHAQYPDNTIMGLEIKEIIKYDKNGNITERYPYNANKVFNEPKVKSVKNEVIDVAYISKAMDEYWSIMDEKIVDTPEEID